MKKKRIIVVGKAIEYINDNEIYEITTVDLSEIPSLIEEEEFKCDLLILTDTQYDDQLLLMEKFVSSYYVLYREDNNFSNSILSFVTKKMGFAYNPEDENVIRDALRVLFVKPYGAKLGNHLFVPNSFTLIHSSFQGHEYITLNTVKSDEFRMLGTYEHSILCNGDPLDLWPEILCPDTAQVIYKIRLIEQGSVDHVIEEWQIPLENIKDRILIDTLKKGYLSVSIFYKGEGDIQVGSIHYRNSFLQFGQYQVGGKKKVDMLRNEVFYYFDPKDWKPPLTVYFSGYRPMEGFEGYWMMNRLKTPFLLLSDPRLEGGAFYLGSDTFEDNIKNIIQECLDTLGFTNQELILSGLSMGTFGAMYYGAKLLPHNIIVGKPLASLGSMAANETLHRPGGFATSLDVLLKSQGDIDDASVQNLNKRFWDAFGTADFTNTELDVAYMKQDDYDMDAYQKMMDAFKDSKVTLIGRGYQGRHNDDSPSINSWFFTRYQNVIQSQFRQKDKNNQ